MQKVSRVMRFTAAALLVVIFTGFEARRSEAILPPQAGAKPVRIGVIGLDNYQAVAYTQLFNYAKAPDNLTGLRVVAAFAAPASADIPESVDNLPKWKAEIVKFDVKLVASIDELLKVCDAVMIMSVDGRKHLEQATPVLKAGKRLYIGRPLAASLADAVAILRLAEQTKTPCWSSSQHRFSPGFIGMRNHPEVGKVLGCDVYGGCPTEPHHAEFFWHAVHGVETLYTIMGPGCATVRCTSTPAAEVIAGAWTDGRVGTFRGIKQGTLKYSATVFGDKGVSVAGIYGHGVPKNGVVPTNDKYMGYEGIAIEMAKFFKGGATPVSAAETLELFAFMEAAHESKRQQGAMVKVAEILTKAGGKDIGKASVQKADPRAEELWNAARKGDAAAAQALLAQGVDVNATSTYGATALSFAADNGHIEVVKLLLAHQADVNAKDSFYQQTPLSWAISKKRAAIVKLLVDAGASGSEAALALAAAQGDADLVETVLKKAKPTAAVLNRALAATPKDKTQIIDLLTKAGAKVVEAKKDVVVEASILNSYVGAYRNDDQARDLKIELAGGRLQVKTSGFLMHVLRPLDAAKFQPIDNEAITFAFQRDGDKVAALVSKTGAIETKYRRLEARMAPAAAKSDDAPVPVKSPANWPSFRGPGASGVADGQHPPTSWDAAAGHNVRWKTPIPGLGHSCPVVWSDRIFLTTAVSSAGKVDLKTGLFGNVDSVNDTSPHSFQVLCLDKATGKTLWNRVAHLGVPKVKRHTKATHANSTCATDGQHVIACFGSEGLYCYDVAGKLLWKQELGVLESGWFYDPEYQWGFGSSPIIYKNLAIVQCDAGKNSFIAAFDVASGKRVWLTERDEIPSWGTPTVIESKTGPELVTNATKFARGYDPFTGKELWRLGRNSEIAVPTPFTAHGLIYVISGYRAPRPIYAIRPGARGDITLGKDATSSEAIAWSNDKGGTYMPTPLAYGDYLYTGSDNGTVTCYDVRTGKRIWWERLGSDAGFTASPVAADGRLYFTSEDGQTHVVKAGPKFELLAVNSLGDPCLATPAISDGMMFVRTQSYLFGLGRSTVK